MRWGLVSRAIQRRDLSSWGASSHRKGPTWTSTGVSLLACKVGAGWFLGEGIGVQQSEPDTIEQVRRQTDGEGMVELYTRFDIVSEHSLREGLSVSNPNLAVYGVDHFCPFFCINSPHRQSMWPLWGAKTTESQPLVRSPSRQFQDCKMHADCALWVSACTSMPLLSQMSHYPALATMKANRIFEGSP